MKKISLFTLGIFLILGFSCKQTKKDSKKELEDPTELAADSFTLLKDSTKVSFTAYKTTAKIAVGGQFRTINISNINSGNTPLGALDGTEFGIPVSSLFTNDATGTRDPKILEFFFGVMQDTEIISGVFKIDADNKCSIDVTMNRVNFNIPLEYVINTETSITFNGMLNLEDWNALEAVTSINNVCKELHTGKDGVSKTWTDVAVQAQVLLTKN